LRRGACDARSGDRSAATASGITRYYNEVIVNRKRTILQFVKLCRKCAGSAVLMAARAGLSWRLPPFQAETFPPLIRALGFIIRPG
jgi:hypothetical protein